MTRRKILFNSTLSTINSTTLNEVLILFFFKSFSGAFFITIAFFFFLMPAYTRNKTEGRKTSFNWLNNRHEILFIVVDFCWIQYITINASWCVIVKKNWKQKKKANSTTSNEKRVEKWKKNLLINFMTRQH